MVALDQPTRAEKMRTLTFQRLMATKINEEIAAQFQDNLTAHEFLDCGYGHDIRINNHGDCTSRTSQLDTRSRRSLPISPKKRKNLNKFVILFLAYVSTTTIMQERVVTK